MIVLDTSASMNDPIDGGGSKWSAVATAIGSVVEARSRMASWGLALMSSPSGACDAGSIAVPLSLGSGYIASALSARTNGDALVAAGNRPMRAALNLAAAHLSARNPGPHHVILLITDGLPNCIPGIVDVLSDDSQGALDAVTNAVIDGVTTAVVGLGIGAGPADTTLTNLAIAGGLGRSAAPVYYPASSSGDVAAAMNALLDDAYTCTFFVPEPPTTDGTTSRSLIQVRVGGTYVPQDPLNGWTYTDESQFGIDLHGSACDAAINGAAGAVTIVFPCYLQ
jgi:hypothetical protein